MKKEDDAAATPQGYVLSESQHEQLQKLCDHLFLMADFVTASTQEENDELLQIKRSRLGWLFESCAFQLEQLLLTIPRAKRSLPMPTSAKGHTFSR